MTAANASLLGPTLVDDAVPSTSSSSSRRRVRARGVRLVPLTAALVVATLAGIAVAAGAPWREESGGSTSAGAQSADNRLHQGQMAAVRSIARASTRKTGQCSGGTGGSVAASRMVAGCAWSLIDEINRQLRVGDGLLARLEGVTPAGDVRARTLQARTGATWSRSLDRLRSERDALERGRSERAASVQRRRCHGAWASAIDAGFALD